MKTGYPIDYGDRIYVRATQDGVKMLELTVTNVADLTALVGEIRYEGRKLEGLAQVFIRNHSKGWSMERPLRFYNGVPSPQRRKSREVIKAAGDAYSRRVSSSGRYVSPIPGFHTIFPWETH